MKKKKKSDIKKDISNRLWIKLTTPKQRKMTFGKTCKSPPASNWQWLSSPSNNSMTYGSTWHTLPNPPLTLHSVANPPAPALGWDRVSWGHLSRAEYFGVRPSCKPWRKKERADAERMVNRKEERGGGGGGRGGEKKTDFFMLFSPEKVVNKISRKQKIEIN